MENIFRESMKKAIVLILVMALTLVTFTTGVYADKVTTSLNFTADNPPSEPNDGYTWDSGSNKLTLDRFDIEVTVAAVSGQFVGANLVTLPANSILILSNTNTMQTNVAANVFNMAIYSTSPSSNVFVEGDGTLNINDAYYGFGYCLPVVVGGTINMTNCRTGFSTLILDDGNVTISNPGYGVESKATVNGGTLKVENSRTHGIGTLVFTGGHLIIDNRNTSIKALSAAPTLPSKYLYRTSPTGEFINGSKTPYKYSDSDYYFEIKSSSGDENSITDTPPKGTLFSSGKYTYKITDAKTNGKGTVAVTGFAKGKSSKTVSIGKTVKYKGYTYKITSVGKNAFKGNKKITAVKLGNNIKTIGNGAFYKVTKLKKLTIGTGLTKIGNHVFCHDTKLKTMTINSKKLKSVGKHNLYKVKNLKIKALKSQVKKYTKLFKNKGQKKNAKIKVVKK